jgi:predicted flap endonuclease-1-like 5' DNA nuclease
MQLMFKLIAAAHARGTHHHLAIDGIEKLGGDDAVAWQRVFIKHAAELVRGAKAPDEEFKDFKNHVLHPRDGFWGGAAEKACEWYQALVERLREREWPAVAWSAGVLSHYVTDPIHPFHTAQSEAENTIHRALEWSISKSYADLKQVACAKEIPAFDIADGPGWLEELVADAASEANAHYEKLIAHYDIRRGVVDPPSGLDPVAQRIVGRLIGRASATFAVVLGRALQESGAAPPEVSLTLEALIATLRIPINSILKRISDSEERRLVQRIYDELMETGAVVTNLPEDDRTVRDLHAAEVLAKQTLSRERRRAVPETGGAIDREAATTKSQQPTARPAEQRSDARAASGQIAGSTPAMVPQPAWQSSTGNTEDLPAAGRPIDPDLDRSASSQAIAAPMELSLSTRPVTDAIPPDAERAPVKVIRPRVPQLSEAVSRGQPCATGASEAATRPPRFYLTEERDIVDAPSIGPRMAERLEALGIRTVGDLKASDPAKIARDLGRSDVDGRTVRDWQDQAGLVCLVPGLRGTHAQLLVGAGFRTVSALAEAEEETLCSRVFAFASSAAGQRLLRQGDAPDIAKIRSWLESARTVLAA